MKHSIITALDVGSSFIRAIIAQVGSDGRMEIKGVGETQSKGIEAGIVKDIQALSQAIQIALEEAEKSADTKATNIFANITGKNIVTNYGDGRISIPKSETNEPGEISQEHLDQVISDAKNKSNSILKGFDRLHILHGIPQNYIIDGQDDIHNPINMNGFQLNANVYNIFIDVNSIRNLSKSIELAGYEIDPDNFVLNHVAVGKAVLSDDEKRLGCIQIDFGGGTCDISLFDKGILRKVFVVPMAGNDISNDLAIGLKTTLSTAEEIKIEYGVANSELVDKNIEIEVEGISGRASQKKSQFIISQIIQHRLEEILTECYNTAKANYMPEMITAGVVLTGGSANLRGIDTVMADAFNLNVKIAVPDLSMINGMISRLDDPSYATALGLLYYAKDLDTEFKPSGFKLGQISSMKFVDKLKNILKEI